MAERTAVGYNPSVSPTPEPDPRRRTAFAQRVGAVRRAGDVELSEVLAAAFEASAAEADRWTHGFHAYPARMHPAIAAHLCERFARPGGTVLDPFCGSGTVLLEAMVRGAHGVGVDLNPLALRLAALKCSRLGTPARAKLLAAANEVAERTLAGVRARVEIRAPLSVSECRQYQSHVLRELAVLHHEIRAVTDRSVREALLMVFSSLVVKFSRQRADTSETEVEKRIGKGVPTRFFARKTEELVRRLAELNAALPPGAVAPKLILADARTLADQLAPGSAELVITSPPYVGTYDYVDHHARRWQWLDIEPLRLRAGEIGARRDHTGAEGRARWDRDLLAVLGSTAHALAAGGLALWLIGDGEIAGQRIPADVQLRELAGAAGLEVVAVASQRREDWRGGKPREEHLIAMRPGVVSAPAPRRSPPRSHRDPR
jgi:SAM-dependent methyltransferase